MWLLGEKFCICRQFWRFRTPFVPGGGGRSTTQHQDDAQSQLGGKNQHVAGVRLAQGLPHFNFRKQLQGGVTQRGRHGDGDVVMGVEYTRARELKP